MARTGSGFCHRACSCAIIQYGNPREVPENRKGPHLRSPDSPDMKIEVEFSPAFQSRLSLERQTLILEEGRSTVKDLFERLLREHGGKIRPLLFAQKEDEILSGLIWVGIFYNNPLDRGGLWGVYYIFIFSALLVIAVYDFKWKIIPDSYL